MVDVQAISLDSFNFPRLDLIKIDVEGMELEVLAGGANCIAKLHRDPADRDHQERLGGAQRLA